MKNALHEFLEILANSLSLKIERTTFEKARLKADVFEFSKQHGIGRATAQGTLAELILEFHILRETIFSVLEADGQLPALERNIILNAIEQAVSDAATQFALTQTEAQEQFAMTVVHDLHNPIFIAKSNAQLIRRHATNSKLCAASAAKIDEKLNRLEAMIRELLDVSRVRAGAGLAFELERLRLDVLVKQVMEELKVMHGDRFVLDIAAPVTSECNADGIRRILENLVVNAMKYGSAGKPIRVALTQTAKTVKLTVHNEGNPIPSAEQSKLFAKYMRASTAKSKTGWGLGLALVSGVAKAHHGTARVKSSLETGTDFIIELPKKPA